MKILFLAGGTGGHITPALAVADAVRERYRDIQIVFVSGTSLIDEAVFTGHNFAYRRHTLQTGKLRRYLSWRIFQDLWYFCTSFFQAWRILRTEKPDLIFAKGGHVALPLCLLAKLFRIPFVIHESDSAFGLTNRFLQSFATRVLTAFPPPKGKGEYVGTPVRTAITSGNADLGRAFLKAPANLPILLVMGGSQGSESMNRLLLLTKEVLAADAFIVHLSGSQKLAAPDSSVYRHYDYLGEEFGDVLQAAEVIVARAGANSLFEYAAAKKPMILIPLPSAAQDHQRRNAEFFQKEGAALVLEETTLTSAEFQKTIRELLHNTEQREKMKKAAANLLPKDSAGTIAAILWQLLVTQKTAHFEELE
jgi:UDP-N-acetylglucosamine--N-acetylmuramyl-(pentapeptide) pyrophosphoryl-undecaprenol N-acetylglucosamine transferase